MRAPVGQVLSRRTPVPDRWFQIGLAPSHGRAGTLFGELSATVRDWRDRQLVDDFFFMNKPPGVRVRFATEPGQTPFVRAAVRRLVRNWCAGGLVADIVPGVYEPEHDRFGGRVAMDHAHRMFTVDAMAWLEFHARPHRTPAWALSLAMLRPVFDAMDVDPGREHAIWARVAAAGRLLPEGVTAPDAVTAGLRRWWRTPGALPEEEVRQLAAVHAARVAPLAGEWAATLRDSDSDSDVTFDEAVAWYVVFHWNRAALSFGRQALLTESLSTGSLSTGGGDVR